MCCLTLALSAGLARADGPTLGPCPPAGATEATAAPLPAPVLCRATFASASTDWYAIPLARSQRVLIQVNPEAPLLATSFTLKDPFSVPSNALCTGTNSTETNAVDSCDFTATQTGSWKLGIAPTAGLGSYHIAVETTPAQADCGSVAGDAPEGAPIGTGGALEATPVTLPATTTPGERKLACTGTFGQTDKHDWYSFAAAAGQVVKITAGPDALGPAPLTGTLTRVGGMVLKPPPGGGDNATGTSSITFHTPVSGTFYLDLSSGNTGNDSNPYNFTISTQQNDCGVDANEAPNSSAAPFAINAGATGAFVSCLGALDVLPTSASDATPPDAADWYTFSSKAGTPVAIGIDSSAGQCTTMKVFRPGAGLGAPTQQLTTCDGAAPAVFNDANAGGGTWTIAIVNGASILALDSYDFAYADTPRSTDSDPRQVTVFAQEDNTKITGLATRGLNAGDFPIGPEGTCAVGTTLNKGQSCTVVVRLRPVEEGPRSAALAISAGVPGAPATNTTRLVSLAGSGIAAIIQFAPTSLAFAPTKYKAASDAQTVTISNVHAGGALSIGSIFVGGTNPGDFEIATDKVSNKKLDQCSNQILSPGASCTVKVDFIPQGNGARAAQLIVPNDSGSPARTALSATGLAPVPTAAPDSLSFGSTTISQDSAPLNVTVTNAGSDSLTNLATAFTGNFKLGAGSTCTGASVAPGGSCTFAVVFSPTGNEGTQRGSVKITSSSPATAPVVSLSGIATTSGASPVLTPSDELDFDAQVLNTASAQKSVSLKNAGSGALAIASIDVTPNHTEFLMDRSACPASLNAGATCNVQIAFKPTKTGARATNLNFSFTIGTGTVTKSIEVLGIGIAAGGHLTIGKPVFPNTLVGATSARVQISLKNTGTANVNAIGLNVDSSEFAVRATTCGGAIAPNKSCTAELTFTPSAMGDRTGTLTVSSDESGSPQTIALSAKGLAPLATASAPSFPTVTLGGASVTKDLVISNPGTAPLAVSGITVDNPSADPDFVVSNDNCTDQNRPAGQETIPAGGSCAVTFVFVPRDTGTRTATVEIATNAAGPSPTLQLTGVALGLQSALIGGGGAYTLTANGVSFDVPAPPNDCGLAQLDASNATGAPSDLGTDASYTCAGAIQDAADTGDYYKLSAVAATDIVHVTFPDPLPAGTLVCQYDALGHAVDATYDSDAKLVACGTDHRISGDELANSSWTIGVTGPAGATYDFTVTIVHQNDCGIGADAANTLDEAAAGPTIDASLPFLCSGAPVPALDGNFTKDGDLRDPNDRVDVYKVTTGSSSPTIGALAVLVTPTLPPDLGAGSDFDVVIHAPDGTTTTTGLNGGSGQPEVALGHCGITATTPCAQGVWYVEIRHIRGAFGPYKMLIAGRTV
jgi:hypothetical protein